MSLTKYLCFFFYLIATQFDLQHKRLHRRHWPPTAPARHPRPQPGPQDARTAEEDLPSAQPIGRKDQSEVTGAAGSSERGRRGQGTHFAHAAAHASGVGGL